jgi:hypothetical protein
VWNIANAVYKEMLELILADFAKSVGAGPTKRIVRQLDNAGWHGPKTWPCLTAFASCSSQPTVRSSNRPNIFGPSSTNHSPIDALITSRAWTKQSATAVARSLSSKT